MPASLSVAARAGPPARGGAAAVAADSLEQLELSDRAGQDNRMSGDSVTGPPMRLRLEDSRRHQP